MVKIGRVRDWVAVDVDTIDRRQRLIEDNSVPSPRWWPTISHLCYIVHIEDIAFKLHYFE